MNVREKIESFERLTLIKEAIASMDSLGRIKSEPQDNIRTCFMVDRDRIIHSKSFSRLKHKTQVFIKAFGDHYKTRLTHTLEVSQIARTIGVGIGLNETLIEAIALGHDIGHVAFAHNGEEVLNKFLKNGFKHSEQSVRVVTVLEKEGKGLNLTKEVIDGIKNHSGLSNNNSKTLEAVVVQYSDKIAYLNHDIDDSIRAKVLNEEDIPKGIIDILGNSHSKRVDTLVCDFINTSLDNLNKGIVKVGLSAEIEKAMKDLRKFMFEKVYLSHHLKEERNKAKFVLEELIEYYMNNIYEMPKLYIKIAQKEGKERAVADYIAGMSDDYCLSLFNKIYVPKLVIY
ncbi:deoxyguanosinetriphosphate triphosphohydrolase [Clostridium sp. HCP1S3_B4]|uniref:deoxyguanosinetriphosphate triphosphohydrolase n=1 Tax=unclassified Clostridium TaxID=2614128 RepID=UPI0016B9300B|nr:deoxyguanosinetriphosphate triphosphohydrolase [Clostridiales bacterium]NLK24756.1 deoxyguanosinetriphosphate triphosphohydrolase [Clostridiales bacterium]